MCRQIASEGMTRAETRHALITYPVSLYSNSLPTFAVSNHRRSIQVAVEGHQAARVMKDLRLNATFSL
jgi:hypothetical protein